MHFIFLMNFRPFAAASGNCTSRIATAPLAGREPGRDGMPVKYEFGDVGLELFDLSTDPGETKNVAAEHPEIVKQLQAEGATLPRRVGRCTDQNRGQGATAGRTTLMVSVAVTTHAQKQRR